MIGPFGRQGPAATLRQHSPQMTQRRCRKDNNNCESHIWECIECFVWKAWKLEKEWTCGLSDCGCPISSDKKRGEGSSIKDLCKNYSALMEPSLFLWVTALKPCTLASCKTFPSVWMFFMEGPRRDADVDDDKICARTWSLSVWLSLVSLHDNMTRSRQTSYLRAVGAMGLKMSSAQTTDHKKFEICCW